MSGGDSWRFRAVIFFSLLLVLEAAALLRAVLLAGPRIAEYIAQGEKMARFHGTLPAMRGRILDRAGRTLVWSERAGETFCTAGYAVRAACDGAAERQLEFQAVRSALGRVTITSGGVTEVW